MCTRPITIRYCNVHTLSTGYRSIQVPCGKCMECRKKYQNDWAIRINQEIKSSGYKGVFVTLTYNDDSVPKVVDKSTGVVYRSVCKRHVQNAIKRFRTSFYRSNGKPVVFRYFLTSEYGPRTFRPHYHAIFFGLTYKDLLPFISDWQSRYGYVVAQTIKLDKNSSALAKYVAKYCSKGVFECPYVAQGFVAPTFHLMSKGLGKSFLDDRSVWKHYVNWPIIRKYKYKSLSKSIYTDEYLEFVGTQLRMELGGFLYSMPRYYKTKLYGTQNDLSEQVSAFLLRRNDELYRQKCELISAERHCSVSEASYYLARQEDFDRSRREDEAKDSFERFYNKSKL